jgi:hypothetical protein
MAKRKSKTQIDLERRLAAAQVIHLSLMDQKDASWSHQRNVAIADAACWRLRALIQYETQKYEAANKASKAAEGLEAYAAKLEKVSLGDRVYELEQRLGQGRKTAHALAELEESE